MTPLFVWEDGWLEYVRLVGRGDMLVPWRVPFPPTLRLAKVAKVGLGPIKFAARSGGHTPLMAACREGHNEVVQLLCEKAADKDRIIMGGFVIFALIAGPFVS